MSAVAIASERDRKRLVDLLGRLGSDHEGERSAAALLADRHVRHVLGTTWQELIDGAFRVPALPCPPPRRRQPSTQATMSRLRWLITTWVYLSSWEQRFVVSCHDHGGPFSDRQIAVIERIAARVERCCGASAEVEL